MLKWVEEEGGYEPCLDHPDSAAQRLLAERDLLVQRGVGRAIPKGGNHVGCNFTRHLSGRPYCRVARWPGCEGNWLRSGRRHCNRHRRGSDRELVAPTPRYPPRLRGCSSNNRRHHRRDYSAAHPQTGLQARKVVTA